MTSANARLSAIPVQARQWVRTWVSVNARTGGGAFAVDQDVVMKEDYGSSPSTFIHEVTHVLDKYPLQNAGKPTFFLVGSCSWLPIDRIR
jgi:hypothetical protein